MKRLGYTLLFYFTMCCGIAHAGQVILTMPDEQIQSVLHQVCTWNHCWKDGTTYASDTELGQRVVDQLVETVSFGHYHSLEEIGGHLEIRYDEPREPIVP